MTGRWLWTGVVALAALLGLGACGDPTATTATLAPTTVAATTTTVAPATTVRTISTSTTPPVPLDTTTTTAAPETSTTTTSVADDPTAGLPTPQPPPADPNAPEAVHRLGRIEIPKIDVTKDLFEGVTLTTLNRGPGHWPGTALPGQDGNVVVGGHRVSHDKPFRHIDELVAGDEVVFTTDGGRFVYRVVSSEVVTPDAVWIVNQTPQPTATLFACTPPGSTSHRLVVHLALET